MICLDRDWLQEYPQELIGAIAGVAHRFQAGMYVTGGAVRDWLLGRATVDLDITVTADPFGCCRMLAETLGGAFVPLDEEEGVARMVWGAYCIDFAGLREGSSSIEEDLVRRDFTINALAVAVDPGRGTLKKPFTVIDPSDGIRDIQQGIVRVTSATVFDKDPLRLLRAYRFKATLGFVLERKTEELAAAKAGLIRSPAAERISAELHKIMAAPACHEVIAGMARSGLLLEIFPELHHGAGVEQPASHHLDVFDHNLAALFWIERIMADPAEFFPASGRHMTEYLQHGRVAERLKWASLFHDLGKPYAHKIRNSRITFYNHDTRGAELFTEIAGRLRLGREETGQISRFIRHHMWPFHLSNAWSKTGITPRACLRLVKAIDDDLPGLFLLAMADSLAGQGPGKPPAMEEKLARLYNYVRDVYQKSIRPVFEQPRLLTGHDLKEIFGLTPGPVFREIFSGIEDAQVEGKVRTREEAIAWVTVFLETTPPFLGRKGIKELTGRSGKL